MRVTLNNFFIIVLIGVLLNLGGCSGNKVMNEKKFTKYYLKVLEQQLPDIDFIILEDLVIASKNELETKHFLDNAYITYKSNPAEIEDIVSQYIKGLMVVYEKQPIQKNRIIPMIKANDYLDIIKSLNNDKEKEMSILYEQYNSDLVIIYMEDTEYSLSSISTEDLKDLGIDKDTLFDFSIGNLKEILPEIQRVDENGYYYIVAGGTFEASLILLKTLWTKENFNVDGEFVVAIPCRDLLMITGSNNKDGIETLKSFAEKMYKEGDHNISPFLYKWNGKKFDKLVNGF